MFFIDKTGHTDIYCMLKARRSLASLGAAGAAKKGRSAQPVASAV